MVVGFVSAGPESDTGGSDPHGANIGTTITAWLSMNQLGDAFAVFQPALPAPAVDRDRAIFMLFGKNEGMKAAGGEILVGLVVFVGVSIYRHTPTRLFFSEASTAGKQSIAGQSSSALVTALRQNIRLLIQYAHRLTAMKRSMVTTKRGDFHPLGQNIGSIGRHDIQYRRQNHKGRHPPDI